MDGRDVEGYNEVNQKDFIDDEALMTSTQNFSA